MSDFVGGAAGDAIGGAIGRRLAKGLLGVRFECSLRALEPPAPAGLSTRWRTGAAEMGPTSLIFSANLVSGIRFPHRRVVQIPIQRIDFGHRRELSRWEGWYLALAADTVVEVVAQQGQTLEWALPSDRLDSIQRRRVRGV